MSEIALSQHAERAERARESWRDPAVRARRLEDIGRPRSLPPMTPAQRKLYKKMLREGVSRYDALRSIGLC